MIIDGKRFEVTTHQHAELSEWIPVAGKVRGVSDTTIETNMALDEIRKKVDVIYFSNQRLTPYQIA